MEFCGKTAVFRADMTGLGIYRMGGFGRIGVYRVKIDRVTFFIFDSDMATYIPKDGYDW